MANVNIIIPVFNRLPWTVGIIKQLNSQSSKHNIKIIVINDGSNDGTREYLESQSEIVTLQGDGNLWWSGSINLGLEYLIKNGLNINDYVVLLNNDVYISSDYINNIVQASVDNGNIPVGSILCELNNNKLELKSIGPLFDAKKIDLYDANKVLRISDVALMSPYYDVDLLSGRGTLYPGSCVISAGLIRSKVFPHYYGDYDYSARLKRRGIRLIVASKAVIISPPEYGNDTSLMNFRDKWFSKKSADNIFYSMVFYFLISRGLWKIKSFFIVPYPFLKDSVKNFLPLKINRRRYDSHN